MSFSVSTSTSSKRNKKYQQKGPITLKGKTKYIPLIPQDALYRQNIFRLSNTQFQAALQKALKDLTALLHYNESDFFQQLQISDSLRVCLQSCLVCLCKNSCYNLCSTKILQQNKQKIDFPNNYFIYYEKLNQVVLTIYFRIVHAQKIQHKQIIYNSWLLDIPKMIDFCMIYCIRTDSQDNFTNLELVQLIISKAILSNPKDYAKDFDDFINTLYEDKLPYIHKDIKYLINLSPQAMQKARHNFQNPLRSFLITSNKIIFQVKDLYTLISYVYRCFPLQFRQKLATDHQILEDSFRIYIEFVQNTPLWKTAQFNQQFKINFQDTHRTACQCFLFNLKILKQIINKGDTISNTYFSRSLTSYSVHCLYITSNKINKDYQKIYQTMIKTIIYRFGVKELFFLRQAPSKLNFLKLSQDEKIAIKKSYIMCQKMYEQLQQIKQDKQISKRIKCKMDQFFKKEQKPKQQDKIMHNIMLLRRNKLNKKNNNNKNKQRVNNRVKSQVNNNNNKMKRQNNNEQQQQMHQKQQQQSSINFDNNSNQDEQQSEYGYKQRINNMSELDFSQLQMINKRIKNKQQQRNDQQQRQQQQQQQSYDWGNQREKQQQIDLSFQQLKTINNNKQINNKQINKEINNNKQVNKYDQYDKNNNNQDEYNIYDDKQQQQNSIISLICKLQNKNNQSNNNNQQSNNNNQQTNNILDGIYTSYHQQTRQLLLNKQNKQYQQHKYIYTNINNNNTNNNIKHKQNKKQTPNLTYIYQPIITQQQLNRQYIRQQQLRYKIYNKCIIKQQQDDYQQQQQQQKQQYYHSNKPQFGLFQDHLLQIQQWKHKQFINQQSTHFSN